jgi:hypothetical protein
VKVLHQGVFALGKFFPAYLIFAGKARSLTIEWDTKVLHLNAKF